ncbi:MAG: DUF4249 family protein [Bacteroidota bacterium]
MPSRIATLILLVAVLAGCDATDAQPDANRLVVEAYLYAGEPVTDVRVTEAALLSDEDTTPTPVTDATVTLFRGDEAFRLRPSDDEGHYAYEGSDLAIDSGETFRLEVTRGGALLTATTTVPSPPQSIGVTEARIAIPRIRPGGGRPGQGGQPGAGLADVSTTVFWANPNAELHFVVVESEVTGTPEFILPDALRDRFQGFRLITQPTDESSFVVNLARLEVVGPHTAIVYRVNTEYADLYANRTQDSRDLNEPPTNVRGGLGLFSAFSSQRVGFEVVRD